MIKIAVFTEGQGELIFIRHLLGLLFHYDQLSFRCLKLHDDKEISVPYKYTGAKAKLHFQIINVENDERVLSAIKEREQNLFKNGFQKIIGLRDLYSETYDRAAHGHIDPVINVKIKNMVQTEILQTSQPAQIKIFFAIMEFEAWLLGMYHLFAKMNLILTWEYIENQLNFDLKHIDPQKKFYRPGKPLQQIFNLIQSEYDKSTETLEKICSFIELNDLNDMVENDRCAEFKEFFEELMQYQSAC